MYEYPSGDVALDLPTDPDQLDSPSPDDDAVLLDVAAHFASDHGVPGLEGASVDRDASLWRAARHWPLLVRSGRRGGAAAEGEVFELLRDAVDARDRFPQLWSAATEDGAVGGRELRQLVRQHQDKAWAETRRIDADQAAVLRSEPDLWHAVFRASRFLGRLHDHGLSDDQILALLDQHLQDPDVGLQAS